GAFGGMLGAMFATNVGGMAPLGVAGWRVAFMAVGAVSLAIGAFTLLMAVDPTRHHHNAPCRRVNHHNHRNRRNRHPKEHVPKAAAAVASAAGTATGDVSKAAAHQQQKQRQQQGLSTSHVGAAAVASAMPRHVKGAGGDGDDETGVDELPYLQSCEIDPDRDSEHLYDDSDWSAGLEVEPLLIRRKAATGSDG
ncbi:hypothetical protein Vafri_8584, partial [Volvox africanus]